ncbi:SDR family oxidoreductase [Polynucleobacter bastaniensis]|uniref:SDR family oxidoreductase n=1 Tax=Polynucleobacter bastaniensis TaxID=2081039 RepID=UPI001C0D6B69|nr:SDR family oxidoreductase [Polynucleobacter bastaniensis]MBU3598282.1 SDR family oxidoreductase [Polynucleobacter bastaniensis]
MSNYSKVQGRLKANSKKWLVTGVCGFIGSNLLEELLNLDQYVIGIDNLSTGYIENLHEVKNTVGQKKWDNFKFLEFDILNLESCMKACEGVDYVLHQAALGSISRSIKNPLGTNAVNINGFLNMLFAAKSSSVSKFVYASSSSVYGDHPDLPKVETKIGKPLSPYATTKLCDELYAEVFRRTYGLDVAGLRYFNVFGKRQNVNGEYAAVIPKWISAVIKGEGIDIYGDGETSRDFCYIKNVIQANILAAVSEHKSESDKIYNIAVGDRTTLNDLIKIITQVVANKIGPSQTSRINYGDFRVGDIRHSLAEISKAKRDIGYAPQYDLMSGIIETVDWYCNDLV